MIANLVKAFDTLNHTLMIVIFRGYGCPPKLQSEIERIYKNSVLRLVIGKISTTIPFQVGLKQDKNISSVIFIFTIIAFAETLDK